jgi:hypothetical protein
VGIFASAIVVLLALLPGTLRESADAADSQMAAGLPDAIRIELERTARQRGLDALAAAVPMMGATGESGDLWVATRAGTAVRLLAAGESPLQDQYFLIELRRFSGGQLAYDPAAAFLALHVQLSWPYRRLTPEGLSAAVPREQRQQVGFTLVLNR